MRRMISFLANGRATIRVSQSGKEVAVFCGKTQLESVRAGLAVDWRLTEQSDLGSRKRARSELSAASLRPDWRSPNVIVDLSEREAVAAICAAMGPRALRRGGPELPGHLQFA